MSIFGNIKEIIAELLKLDIDKEYVVLIKEPKSKRSLYQNKLLWLLIHKIGKESYQDDNDVYCAMLEKADALSDYVITATEMEDALKKSFRGVRFVKMQDVNNKACYVYKVYLGSSKMSVEEMNELLDYTIKTAGELGIAVDDDYYQ